MREELDGMGKLWENEKDEDGERSVRERYRALLFDM
jgi:hypothetical protein